LEIAVTIDDPKTYTKLPDTGLIETVCESSRGLEHTAGK